MYLSPEPSPTDKLVPVELSRSSATSCKAASIFIVKYGEHNQTRGSDNDTLKLVKCGN